MRWVCCSFPRCPWWQCRVCRDVPRKGEQRKKRLGEKVVAIVTVIRGASAFFFGSVSSATISVLPCTMESFVALFRRTQPTSIRYHHRRSSSPSPQKHKRLKEAASGGMSDSMVDYRKSPEPSACCGDDRRRGWHARISENSTSVSACALKRWGGDGLPD